MLLNDKIGGNKTLNLYYRDNYSINEIGEKIPVKTLYKSIVGFLDYQNGDSKYMNYNAKMQESTHVFICDYEPINKRAEELRAEIDSVEYDVMIVDNVMELDKQLEIYLKLIEG